MPLAFVWGVQGQTLSHARPLALWGLQAGPTTNWLWVRGPWASGAVTDPTARALVSWLCALWGRHEDSQGGRLLPGGASRVWRSPTPVRPSFGACGRGPLPTGCGCGGSGRGDPSPSHSARSCQLALRAVRAARGRPGGGHLLTGCGASGVGRTPDPDRSSFRACCRGPLPTGCGCGNVGVGPRHPPQSSRSCELALRAVGAARGRPGGAPPAWVWGVRGRAL